MLSITTADVLLSGASPTPILSFSPPVGAPGPDPSIAEPAGFPEPAVSPSSKRFSGPDQSPVSDFAADVSFAGSAAEDPAPADVSKAASLPPGTAAAGAVSAVSGTAGVVAAGVVAAGAVGAWVGFGAWVYLGLSASSSSRDSAPRLTCTAIPCPSGTAVPGSIF